MSISAAPCARPAPPRTSTSRRRFIAAVAGGLLAGLWRGELPAGLVGRGPSGQGHPEPRPGIDGEKVLRGEELADVPHLVRLFDSIRQIPQIADGVRCHCGCARVEGYRSLLSCYESPGMAKHCEICQGEGRLAYNRWKEGQTLDQIRRAVDARYGHGGPAPGGAVPEPHHC